VNGADGPCAVESFERHLRAGVHPVGGELGFLEGCRVPQPQGQGGSEADIDDYVWGKLQMPTACLEQPRPSVRQPPQGAAEISSGVALGGIRPEHPRDVGTQQRAIVKGHEGEQALGWEG